MYTEFYRGMQFSPPGGSCVYSDMWPFHLHLHSWLWNFFLIFLFVVFICNEFHAIRF